MLAAPGAPTVAGRDASVAPKLPLACSHCFDTRSCSDTVTPDTPTSSVAEPETVTAPSPNCCSGTGDSMIVDGARSVDTSGGSSPPHSKTSTPVPSKPAITRASSGLPAVPPNIVSVTKPPLRAHSGSTTSTQVAPASAERSSAAPAYFVGCRGTQTYPLALTKGGPGFGTFRSVT